MNPWDLILSGAIVTALILALRKVLRDRKAGKTCDGNCANCGHSCTGKP